jgi:hypothetical protein
VKFIFLSAGARRLDLAIRGMLGIKSHFLVFDPLSHYERPRSVQWDVAIYLSLDSKWEQSRFEKGS